MSPSFLRIERGGGGPSDLHLRIQGRVQGVGFRESMCAFASARGVRGWVRNRSDGSVEAVLRGTTQACAEVLAWARSGGPPLARVDRVDQRPATAAESGGVGTDFRRLPSH